MNKLKFISIILIMDLILSNLIFKNTAYWSQINWEKKWWRVSSKDYHHAILPNIDNTDKLILIFESGKFNSDDLMFINNFIYKYNNNLVGWFLLTNNKQLINKNISGMMNS